MITNTEVFLFFDDKWHALEVKDTVPFPLTYNIADISDITKRNNTFSKTLEFPCTKINDAVFGYIFDIASISNFNINKKVKCTIVSETVPILKEAVLQLTKIKTTDNIHYYYECVIFGDSDNFITDMGSGLMTDIPISELNHIYSEANMTKSWTASWNNGYYYPLADLGRGYTLATVGLTGPGVPLTDMYPVPSVKYLLYKLLSYHGWSVDSDWIQNDPTFNNSYILTGQKPLPPATYSIYNTFQVGLTNSITYSPGTTLEWHYGGAGTQSILFGGNAYGFDIGMNVTSQTYLNPIPNGDNVTAFLARQGTQSTPFKFDDDFSGPNYDIGNNYSLITHKYKVGPNPNPMNFVFSLDIEFPSYIEQTMFNSEVYIKVDWYRSTYPAPNTVYIPTGPTATYAKPGEVPFMGWNAANITGAMGYIAPFPKLNLNPYPKLAPGRHILLDGVPLGDPANLGFNRYAPIEGEEIWAGLTILGAARLYNGLSNPTASIGPSFSFTIHKLGLDGVEKTFLSNNIRTELTPNVSYIGGQSMIPNNMKQVDFFTSIIKQFNLYVEQDKFIPKRLKIEPRDNYYAGGKAKNWTEKVAIDKEVSQDLIAEGQNKQILLTYKLDKDSYNTNFNTLTKNIYGQYRYTLDNEFSKGETKIESIFASTPVSNIKNMTLVVPKIYKDQNSNAVLDNFIPRFLQRANSPTNPNGVIKIPQVGNYWKLGGHTYSVYPYLGHYNDDYFPTSDLNFGEYQPYYDIPTDNLSNNNLFQTYYKRQLDEFTNKESRIITLYMKLTSQDINEFAFSDIIQLDEISSGTTNYFRVNKIDYDPTLKGPFKVELLKLIYFSKPISDQGQVEVQRIDPTQVGIISGRDNYNTESTNIIVGNYNEIQNGAQNTSIIGGSNNLIVRSNSVNLTNAFNNEIEYTNGLSLINAKGNTVSYVEDSIISGNNNIIGTSNTLSSRIFIHGNDNKVSGMTNSFIIGDRATATYSNSFYASVDRSYIGTTTSTITEINGVETRVYSDLVELNSYTSAVGERSRIALNDVQTLVSTLGPTNNFSYLKTFKDSVIISAENIGVQDTTIELTFGTYSLSTSYADIEATTKHRVETDLNEISSQYITNPSKISGWRTFTVEFSVPNGSPYTIPNSRIQATANCTITAQPWVMVFDGFGIAGSQRGSTHIIYDGGTGFQQTIQNDYPSHNFPNGSVTWDIQDNIQSTYTEFVVTADSASGISYPMQGILTVRYMVINK